MTFYGISTTGRSCWIQAIPVGLSFPQSEQLIRGQMRCNGVLDAKACQGERPPDLLQLGLIHAISPRVLDVFKKENVTGFDAVPVVIHHELVGCSISGYRAIIVNGRGGPLNEAAMQPVARSGDSILSCQCTQIFENLWDKTDVFLIDGLGVSLWVTERVAFALQRVRPKLRNLLLEPNTAPFPNTPESAKRYATIPLYMQPDKLEQAMKAAEEKPRRKPK